MGRLDQLGELQLAILRVLWARGETTVVELTEALRPERDIAPTTAATMLAGLEKRELDDHRQDGRKYVYRALVAEEQTRNHLVQELLDRVFQGDPAALVSHLLGGSSVDPAQLDQLRQRIAQREAEVSEPRSSDGAGSDDRRAQE